MEHSFCTIHTRNSAIHFWDDAHPAGKKRQSAFGMASDGIESVDSVTVDTEDRYIPELGIYLFESLAPPKPVSVA